MLHALNALTTCPTVSHGMVRHGAATFRWTRLNLAIFAVPVGSNALVQTSAVVVLRQHGPGTAGMTEALWPNGMHAVAHVVVWVGWAGAGVATFDRFRTTWTHVFSTAKSEKARAWANCGMISNAVEPTGSEMQSRADSWLQAAGRAFEHALRRSGAIQDRHLFALDQIPGSPRSAGCKTG